MMSQPSGFSWVEEPKLAAMARPYSREEVLWLRDQKIDVLLSLTENPLRRPWINDAGLMVVHEPIVDFSAPSLEQLQRCIEVIRNAHEQRMGVAVHCAAGLGRTGTILAAWFVTQGKSAEEAIAHVREIRPGSIETEAQVQVIHEYAKSISESQKS